MKKHTAVNRRGSGLRLRVGTEAVLVLLFASGIEGAEKWWVLEFSQTGKTTAPTLSNTFSMKGEAVFKVVGDGDEFEGEGPFEMKDSQGMEGTGRLSVKGTVSGGTLKFVPHSKILKMKMRGLDVALGQGMDVFSGSDEISIPLRDGAERVFPFSMNQGGVRNETKTVWRLHARSGPPPSAAKKNSAAPTAGRAEKWRLKVEYDSLARTDAGPRKCHAAGALDLKISEKGIATGYGTLSITQTQPVAVMSPAEGTGLFSVTGERRDGNLVLSFPHRSILTQGYIKSPVGPPELYEVSFDAVVLGSDLVLKLESGSTSSTRVESAGSFSATTTLTLVPPPKKSETPEGKGICGTRNTKEKVLEILARWRAKLTPMLPAAETTRVKKYVEKFPLNVSQGSNGIEIRNQKGEIVPVPKRRDWAYAVMGASYTLLGTLAEGKEAFFDVGMWCYLQAALLNVEEGEHLANVGFHLNARREYDDAMTVLCYAASENADITVWNNLSFAMGELGNREGASALLERVIAARPVVPVYRRRLARYKCRGSLEKIMAEGLELPDPKKVSKEVEDFCDAADKQLEAVSEKYRQRGAVLVDEFQAEYTNILRKINDCIANEMQHPGPNQASRMCLHCWVPGGNQVYDAFRKWLPKVKGFLAQYGSETDALCGRLAAQGYELVASSGLEASQADILLAKIHEDIVLRNRRAMSAIRKEIDETAKRVDREFRSAMETPCKGTQVTTSWSAGSSPSGPLAIFRYATVKIAFPFFSIAYNPGGTVNLSMGEGLLLKIKHNIRTGETAMGPGVGYNLGPLAKAEGYILFSETSGVDIKVDVKAKYPKFAPNPSKFTGGTIFHYHIPAVGRSTVKFMGFESH